MKYYCIKFYSEFFGWEQDPQSFESREAAVAEAKNESEKNHAPWRVVEDKEAARLHGLGLWPWKWAPPQPVQALEPGTWPEVGQPPQPVQAIEFWRTDMDGNGDMKISYMDGADDYMPKTTEKLAYDVADRAGVCVDVYVRAQK